MTPALVDPHQVSEEISGPPASETAERLLDAAERLFASRGIDAVSVRAVNGAAGANVAAVHYHFGSKEALVEAVLRRRMDALGARRRAMLADLPTTAPPTVRAVVEALVRPLAELSADATGSGRAYVRFLATLQGGPAESSALLTAAFAPQLGPLDDALARALAHLPRPLRRFRLGLVGTIVVQTLADPELAARSLQITDDQIAHAAVVDALIDAVVGALAAPTTPTASPCAPTEGAPR